MGRFRARGRFVPQSTIDRRMDERDERFRDAARTFDSFDRNGNPVRMTVPARTRTVLPSEVDAHRRMMRDFENRHED
jgi:hypothetical protein